jgi:hypothetical protein
MVDDEAVVFYVQALAGHPMEWQFAGPFGSSAELRRKVEGDAWKTCSWTKADPRPAVRSECSQELAVWSRAYLIHTIPDTKRHTS